MKVRSAVFLALCLAVHCLPAVVRAEDMPPDPDLPQPFDTSAFVPMIKNPPFNRVVDYTDSLLLTGVAYLEGKPMATLLDKLTGKRYVVSDQPNAQGWRLADASVSNQLHGTEIQLQVGEETITIRYSESQLNPGRAGQPGAAASGAQADSGKSRIRTSSFLSQEDQDFYHNGMSKEAHDKFRDTMRSHEDKMSKMTDEQRASYTQKIFSKYKAQDTGTAAPAVPKKAKK